MKTKMLKWLLVITFLVWFLTWQGKRLYPALFGGYILQWSVVAMTAILIPLGMFFSVQALFRNRSSRRDAGWTCIGFVAFFSFIVAFHVSITPMLVRIANTMDSFSSSDDLILAKVLKGLYSENKSAERLKRAQLVYHISGVSMPYQLEDGSYTTFNPVKKDIDAWEETQAIHKKSMEIRDMVDWQLRQLPDISGGYIGAFFLVFLIGILFSMYSRRLDALQEPSSVTESESSK